MPVTGHDGASGGWSGVTSPATTYTTVKFRHVNMILIEEKTDKQCSEEDDRLFRCTEIGT